MQRRGIGVYVNSLEVVFGSTGRKRLEKEIKFWNQVTQKAARKKIC